MKNFLTLLLILSSFTVFAQIKEASAEIVYGDPISVGKNLEFYSKFRIIGKYENHFIVSKSYFRKRKEPHATLFLIDKDLMIKKELNFSGQFITFRQFGKNIIAFYTVQKKDPFQLEIYFLEINGETLEETNKGLLKTIETGKAPRPNGFLSFKESKPILNYFVYSKTTPRLDGEIDISLFPLQMNIKANMATNTSWGPKSDYVRIGYGYSSVEEKISRFIKYRPDAGTYIMEELKTKHTITDIDFIWEGDSIIIHGVYSDGGKNKNKKLLDNGIFVLIYSISEEDLLDIQWHQFTSDVSLYNIPLDQRDKRIKEGKTTSLHGLKAHGRHTHKNGEITYIYEQIYKYTHTDSQTGAKTTMTATEAIVIIHHNENGNVLWEQIIVKLQKLRPTEIQLSGGINFCPYPDGSFGLFFNDDLKNYSVKPPKNTRPYTGTLKSPRGLILYNVNNKGISNPEIIIDYTQKHLKAPLNPNRYIWNGKILMYSNFKKQHSNKGTFQYVLIDLPY